MRTSSQGDKHLQETSKHLEQAVDSFTHYLTSRQQCTFGGARRLAKEHMHKASMAIATLLKEINEGNDKSS